MEVNNYKLYYMPTILHWIHEIKSWDDSMCSKISDIWQSDRKEKEARDKQTYREG